jgi:type IV secretion system protein VirB11
MSTDGLASISHEFLDYQYEVLGIKDYLASSDVTEICINRPGELYLEVRGAWQRVEVPSLTFERARQFCTAVVNESNTGQRITDSDPVVSLTFPTGQRAQFVIPPACIHNYSPPVEASTLPRAVRRRGVLRQDPGRWQYHQ